jgi:hypothetical protein
MACITSYQQTKMLVKQIDMLKNSVFVQGDGWLWHMARIMASADAPFEVKRSYGPLAPRSPCSSAARRDQLIIT